MAALGSLHQRAIEAFGPWNERPVDERARILEAAADRLQAKLPGFAAELVGEARKTWNDAIAEVREAIDFLRYYALHARRSLVEQELPGPTGERNVLRLQGRGVWVCISPWNFPLAIFTGQVAAALVTGNTVLAKPAEQTPGIARRMMALLHDSGVPAEVLQGVYGPGETVGAGLIALPEVAGVVFTGSTQVARLIQRQLADKPGPIVPLIAETGGLNAMVVDPTALPEQVVDAVVQSAFRSAGQRCSALRLLCLHESIADRVIELVQGAASELRCGPSERFDTDVGPLIDREAAQRLREGLARLQGVGRPLALACQASQDPLCVPPTLVEIASLEQAGEELFGPVLMVLRWSGDPLALIRRINALGYGLTLGIQTRIDGRAEQLARAARMGNVYVNRNMTGAVVGVQPFGGEGLSGTGPKAGGPYYLLRFCAEQCITVNTAAAGGNATLMATIAAS
jgi:RHH-type proline utilization regulon transcriptional repressor/proline dehydrogenase/delta 1-pyrroline-5-carboxylate dehydrogenase